MFKYYEQFFNVKGNFWKKNLHVKGIGAFQI
jgi:hypothetical protein